MRATRVSVGLGALLLALSACTPKEEEMSWGVLEGEGTVCGVFSHADLREVLPEAEYTVGGREVRAADGDRPADGYCWLDGPEAERLVHVMVEPPQSSVAAQQWANSTWPKTPLEVSGGEGGYGYRGPAESARDTGAAVVETEDYVAAVFLQHLPGEADGAVLARDLLLQVLDVVDRG